MAPHPVLGQTRAPFSGEPQIRLVKDLAVDREPIRGTESTASLPAAVRPEGRSEVALRAALACLPCLVLVLQLRPVLGAGPGSWVVPLLMAFATGLAIVSVAREGLGSAAFLAFWALYALTWTVVAWHGTHFHRAPRPGALFMNLGEVAEVPLPGWHEVPWTIAAVGVGLGWLARRASPRGRELRLATLVAVGFFAVVQGAAFIRYQTRGMLRFSQYRDLVRTHGLETAATLDAIDVLRSGNGAGVLRELRRDAAANPATPLGLDPVAVDRLIILQVESLDLDALRPEVTPSLLRLWESATRGLLNTQRSSVSGSSSADFQLLTGLRPLSGVPVYRLEWDGGESLPSHATQRGFKFHAYHGNDRNFWNRGPFFSAMGMDFQSSESIAETEFSRWGRADGDLFRHAAARIRREPRAVHFLITLSSHAPYDLVIPPGPMAHAAVETRYLRSIGYVDSALGSFLRSLPTEGRTLVVIYGDHPSGVFDAGSANEESAVPLMLGLLEPQGTLAPLSSQGTPIRTVAGIRELPAVHRFLEDCLDASSR